MEHLSDKLRVGIIQTNIDIKTSWHQDGELIQSMNFESQNMALDEIRRGFKAFNSRGKSAPRIVLVPEYSIPHFAIHHVEIRYPKLFGIVGHHLFLHNGRGALGGGNGGAVGSHGIDTVIDKEDGLTQIVIPSKIRRLHLIAVVVAIVVTNTLQGDGLSGNGHSCQRNHAKQKCNESFTQKVIEILLYLPNC